MKRNDDYGLGASLLAGSKISLPLSLSLSAETEKQSRPRLRGEGSATFPPGGGGRRAKDGCIFSSPPPPVDAIVRIAVAAFVPKDVSASVNTGAK